MSSNITWTAATAFPAFGRSDATWFNDGNTKRDRRGLDRMIQPKAVRTNTAGRTFEIADERLKQEPKSKRFSNRRFGDVTQTFLSAGSGDFPVASFETRSRDRNVRRLESLRYLVAVAVVALRQPRRVQRRNGCMGRSVCGKPLRRWTRRFSSQRDEFYHPNQYDACHQATK